MVVVDLWRRRDGTPTARDGRGMRWRVVVKGYPSTGCRTRGEAERLNAARVTAGPPTPAQTLTIGECLDVWASARRDLARGGRNAREDATAVAARWGSTLATGVTVEAVQAWLDDMQAHNKGRAGGTHPASASTKRKRLMCLRGALKVAVRRGALTRDPLAGEIRLPAPVVREPRVLTLDELQALAGASKYPVSIMLLGTTGVRSGEAQALNVGDVVERRGGMRLRIRRAKNGQPRDVPIPSTVLAMLDLNRSADAPLLATPTGLRWNWRNWRRDIFDPATKALGLDGFRPHDLRHTAVSLWIASGANVKIVQAVAGHLDPMMTLKVYGHLMDDQLDDVATRLDQKLTGNPPKLS